MSATVLPLQCPQCGNANNVIEKEYGFGAEFKCLVCGTTSVMVINQQLYAPRPGDLICVQCGRVSPFSSHYCQCGADLRRKCISCQEEFPIYHNVCDHCGWPQHISLHSQEGHILIVQGHIKALDNADDDAQRELLDMATPPTYLIPTFLTALRFYTTNDLIQRISAELLSRIYPIPTSEILQVLDEVQDSAALETLCHSLSKSPELADEIQPKLLNILKNSPARWAAYETLYAINTPPSILAENLLGILNNSYDGSTRSQACHYLGELGDSATPAIPLLLETLREDNTARMPALLALTKLGSSDKEIIETLLNAYENDSNEQEKRDLIEALGKLGRATVPVLIFLIEREHDPQLEKAVCYALAQIGETAVPSLVNVLKYKQDNPDVHVSACFALGLMQGQAAHAVPTLVDLLNSTDAEPDRQLVYCYALGQIGSSDGVDALIRILKRYEKLAPDYLNVWEAARKALVEIGNPAVPALRDLSNNLFQSKKERDAARSALEMIERQQF